MAETTTPLADPAALARLTGLPVDDLDLLDALQRASDRFRGAVGHPVTLVERDAIVLDGDGTRSLLLPAVPVVAVHQVDVDGQPVAEFQWSRNGILRSATGWPDQLGVVHIVYDHGYPADAIPGDIADVVLEQAQMMLDQAPGVASMSTGGVSVSFSRTGITEAWSTAVERYRIGRGDAA
ncbi:hypothetical protein SAMN05216215_108719 [Saccharopolyspora shandongensis]|uniref:Mobile element protein n=1 Tax=Saccharopolyspora shandongensis TaxID=418495 RepID=A0A1H3TNR4_9PSEU|nr:hypothetical protein [Saccharopolyspora shandongensis]SDZ51275.1 hypothetical protein SAMN05216215_108719 [Saccharopolyspora shandongensis]